LENWVSKLHGREIYNMCLQATQCVIGNPAPTWVCISVSGSLIELVAHTANCSGNSCEKFASKPMPKIGICVRMEWEQVLRMGLGMGMGMVMETGVVTQNGCSNRSSSGSHWWSLSPWTISPFESPLQTIQCCCFRPGRDVIFAASSCEHLTIFAMALIGNGNFMCPQTVSISLAPCTRKNLK